MRSEVDGQTTCIFVEIQQAFFLLQATETSHVNGMFGVLRIMVNYRGNSHFSDSLCCEACHNKALFAIEIVKVQKQ